MVDVTASLFKYLVKLRVNLTISLLYKTLLILSVYFSDCCKPLINILIKLPDKSCKHAFPPPKILAGHSWILSNKGYLNKLIKERIIESSYNLEQNGFHYIIRSWQTINNVMSPFGDKSVFDDKVKTICNIF